MPFFLPFNAVTTVFFQLYALEAIECPLDRSLLPIFLQLNAAFF